MCVSPESSGQLRRLLTGAAGDLAKVATRELATELFARLRTGAAVGDFDAPLDLLAALGLEIEQRAERIDNRFSLSRARMLFEKAEFHVARGALSIEGATVVELGCGSIDPLGALLASVLAGARRAIGVDLDRPQDVASAARAMARIAAAAVAEPSRLLGGHPATREELASRLAGFDLAKLRAGDPAGVDWKRMALLHEPAERTSLADGAADFVCSVSFLEHVADPAPVVAEIARVTRPSGCGSHTIDGSDHRRYADARRAPLDFLREPAGVALVEGSNRLRPLAFEPLFARHGFELVERQVHERVGVDAATRASFAEPWRSLPQEELEAVSVTLHVRRAAR